MALETQLTELLGIAGKAAAPIHDIPAELVEPIVTEADQ